MYRPMYHKIDVGTSAMEVPRFIKRHKQTFFPDKNYKFQYHT